MVGVGTRVRVAGWYLAAGALLVACTDPLITDDSTSDGSGTGSTPATTTTTGPSSGTTTTEPHGTTGPVDSTGSSDTTGPVTIPEHCNPLEQDCPAGYKCSYCEQGSDTCCFEVVDDPQGPGEPCLAEDPYGGADDCDALSFCWGIDHETSIGECVPFCIGSEEALTCADPCRSCAITGLGELPCVFNCDPLVAGSCPPGAVCHPFNDIFQCADFGSMAVGVGDPCDFIDSCSSGMICMNASWVPGCPDGSFCCAPVCNPGAAFDPCPGVLPGTTCQPWYEPGEEAVPRCGYDPPGVCATLP